MYKFQTSEIQADSTDVNAQHQEVLRYFPYGEEVRFWFHAEGNQTVILSPELPKIDIKSVMTVIPEYKEGDHLSFKTKLNGVRRNKHHKERGLKMFDPLIKIGEIVPWFNKIAVGHGFEVACLEKVIPQGAVNCRHKERPFPINSVEFQGRLVVKDSTSFNKAVTHGLGHAKAFGFGVIDIKE